MKPLELRSIEDLSSGGQAIVGVEFKLLRSFPDDRGFFRELIRKSDPFFGEGFAQWSHSKMTLNTVKAWHFHHRQIDWWYLPIGVIEAVLFDNREESPTFRQKISFRIGDPSLDPTALVVVVRIPPGVLHGCKVLSDEAHLFYITSETYDPNDEGRLPYNSDSVPHTWGENVITVPNDRRTFLPTNPRIHLAGR